MLQSISSIEGRGGWAINALCLSQSEQTQSLSMDAYKRVRGRGKGLNGPWISQNYIIHL